MIIADPQTIGLLRDLVVSMRDVGPVVKFRRDGTEIDAAFTVEEHLGRPTSVVFHAAGGTRGTSSARNVDYVDGVDILLSRLREFGIWIRDIYIDTSRTQDLSIADRRLNPNGMSYPLDLTTVDDLVVLRKALLYSMRKLGQSPGAAGGGNSRKRTRYVIDSNTSWTTNSLTQAIASGGSSLKEGRPTAMGDEQITMRNNASEVIRDILDLQPFWTSVNTPTMQWRGALVRSDLVAVIQDWLIGTKWSVEGSDGRGLKSRVPWVRVYEEQASPRPTVGWYVVYLFSADGAAAYLALMQATTDFTGDDFRPKNPEEIQRTTRYVRGALMPTIGERLGIVDQIDLADSRGLGRGYELGTVIAFRYDRAAIPAPIDLEDDLRWLLGRLERLPTIGLSDHDSMKRRRTREPLAEHVTAPADRRAAPADQRNNPDGSVDGFTEDFAQAIELHRQRSEAKKLIDKIHRVSKTLGELLDDLEGSRRPPVSITPDDLERLRQELSPDERVPLADFIVRATALLQVIDAGIVNGDAFRIRNLIETAESISSKPGKSVSPNQPRLATPVRVHCTTCAQLVVGRREPAYNLDSIRDRLRQHEIRVHGGITAEVANELTEARRKLQSGAHSIDACRYRIETVDNR